MMALVLALATGIVRAGMHSEPTAVGATLCPVGQKSKTGTNYCTTKDCDTTRYTTTCNIASLTTDVGNCCMADTAKCGGLASDPCSANAATKFRDNAKAGATAGSDATAKETACCTARGTCPSTGFCPAGYKLKTNPNKCPGAACVSTSSDTCGSTTGDESTCCELDTTKCGGLASNPCSANAATKYRDNAKAGAAAGSTAADKETNCCTAKASCGDFVVKVGTTSGASKSETMLALTLGMFAVAALLS